MKRIWVLVLLISLGLNVGLGMRLMSDRDGPESGRGVGRRGEGHAAHGRWADQDSVSRHRMFHRRVDRVADSLDLDPGQRETFVRVHSETGSLLMQQRVLISEKRDLLHSLVTSEEVDQERIRGAIAELGQEQAVLDSLVAETVLQEMAVLDSDQRARYLEMLPIIKEGGEGMRGRGRPGRHRQ